MMADIIYLLFLHVLMEGQCAAPANARMQPAPCCKSQHLAPKHLMPMPEPVHSRCVDPEHASSGQSDNCAWTPLQQQPRSLRMPATPVLSP